MIFVPFPQDDNFLFFTLRPFCARRIMWNIYHSMVQPSSHSCDHIWRGKKNSATYVLCCVVPQKLIPLAFILIPTNSFRTFPAFICVLNESNENGIKCAAAAATCPTYNVHNSLEPMHSARTQWKPINFVVWPHDREPKQWKVKKIKWFYSLFTVQYCSYYVTWFNAWSKRSIDFNSIHKYLYFHSIRWQNGATWPKLHRIGMQSLSQGKQNSFV